MPMVAGSCYHTSELGIPHLVAYYISLQVLFFGASCYQLVVESVVEVARQCWVIFNCRGLWLGSTAAGTTSKTLPKKTGKNGFWDKAVKLQFTTPYKLEQQWKYNTTLTSDILRKTKVLIHLFSLKINNKLIPLILHWRFAYHAND